MATLLEQIRDRLEAGLLAEHTCLSLGIRGLGPELGFLLSEAEPHKVRSLRSLELAGNWLGDRGVRALARAPWLEQLYSLDLGFNVLTSASVRDLVLPSFWSGLLTWGKQPAAPPPAPAQGPYRDGHPPSVVPPGRPAVRFARLTSLSLRSNDVGPGGARALSASPFLPRLGNLNLSNNALGRRGVAALFKGPGLPRLRTLNLSMNHIGDQGAWKITSAASPFRLSALDLSFNDLTDAGLRALSLAPRLRDLCYLDVSNNRITVAGARAFVRSPFLCNLSVLNLGQNLLSPAEIVTVLADANLRSPSAEDMRTHGL